MNLIAELGPIRQLAWVPDNFEAGLDYWINTMGVGPFHLIDDVKISNPIFNGAPSEAKIGLALSYWGDMQIELVRQYNGAPSIYETQPYKGTSGLHHVCLFVDDVGHAIKVVESAGGKIIFSGGTKEGDMFYAFMGEGHPLVEVIHLGPNRAASFKRMKQACADWDGSDPIRPV